MHFCEITDAELQNYCILQYAIQGLGKQYRKYFKKKYYKKPYYI